MVFDSPKEGRPDTDSNQTKHHKYRRRYSVTYLRRLSRAHYRSSNDRDQKLEETLEHLHNPEGSPKEI